MTTNRLLALTKSVFHGRRILLGVTGSIAAYKAVTLASTLVQSGAELDVILTDSAAKLVAPLTFRAITHGAVLTDLFATNPNEPLPHLALARRAEAMLIAPLTANTLAKLSVGLADNLLTTTALSTQASLLLAPAMESAMWLNPTTREHANCLRGKGVTFVGPVEGRLASGASGVGRMVSPEEILGTLRQLLGRDGPLAGQHVVVTAGGTREPLDPVRFLGNHSSGRMGYALAQAAMDQGASVTLISSTTLLPPPFGLRAFVSVNTAQEMADATLNAIADASMLLMAAAVADFRPVQVADQKIKKTNAGELVLALKRTPDILSLVAERKPPGLTVVGFAAETADLVANAQAKLSQKKLDLIVANPVPAAFAADESEATIIRRDRQVIPLPRQSKASLAMRILDEARQMRASK